MKTFQQRGLPLRTPQMPYWWKIRVLGKCATFSTPLLNELMQEYFVNVDTQIVKEVKKYVSITFWIRSFCTQDFCVRKFVKNIWKKLFRGEITLFHPSLWILILIIYMTLIGLELFFKAQTELLLSQNKETWVLFGVNGF